MEGGLRMPDKSRGEISDKACWEQAGKVFARTGEMGRHSSQQPIPRAGLHNLARALYDDGVLPDDSMQALGAFVASELGLETDACLDQRCAAISAHVERENCLAPARQFSLRLCAALRGSAGR
jgi:hypothetical protein